MAKLVVTGGGILAGEVRALDLFRGLNLLLAPPVFSQIHCFFQAGLTFSGVFTAAPAQIIGRAPDHLLLVPAAEEWLAKPPDDLSALDSLLELVTAKTQAQVWLAGIPPQFFPTPDQAAQCQEFNLALGKREHGGRVRYLDFPGRCGKILAAMDSGVGEALPLHHPGPHLSLFGAMILFDLLLRTELSAPPA